MNTANKAIATYQQVQGATGYYDAQGRQITRAAFYAIKAAAMRQQIGKYAARQYYLRRSGAHSLHLYRIACQLTAMQNIAAGRNAIVLGNW